MRLSTVNKELGVMKAYCGNCRTVLKVDNGKLKCPKCERTETRKLSSRLRNRHYLGDIMELTILKKTDNEINIKVAGRPIPFSTC